MAQNEHIYAICYRPETVDDVISGRNAKTIEGSVVVKLSLRGHLKIIMPFSWWEQREQVTLTNEKPAPNWSWKQSHGTASFDGSITIHCDNIEIARSLVIERMLVSHILVNRRINWEATVKCNQSTFLCHFSGPRDIGEWSIISVLLTGIPWKQWAKKPILTSRRFTACDQSARC